MKTGKDGKRGVWKLGATSDLLFYTASLESHKERKPMGGEEVCDCVLVCVAVTERGDDTTLPSAPKKLLPPCFEGRLISEVPVRTLHDRPCCIWHNPGWSWMGQEMHQPMSPQREHQRGKPAMQNTTLLIVAGLHVNKLAV